MRNGSMNGLSPSTCAEVFARLADYLDRELSSEEARAVEEHLEVCEVCAAEFRFEASVISGIKERVRRNALPESLRMRVTSMLDRLSADRGSTLD